MENIENNEVKRRPGRPPGRANNQNLYKEKNRRLFLDTLKENSGILSPALKATGIKRQTFYLWYSEDAAFREEVDEIREAAIDDAESSLHRQIKNNNTVATIFYLKTRARSRGYIEQTDTNMTIDAVKIKYIVPKEHDDEQISLPLNNDIIKIQLPE